MNIITVVFSVLAAAQGAAEADALRTKATNLFRAKKYAEACDLFAAASAAAPKSGATVADLALCLEKVGRRDAAIEANRRAIVLAADGADPQTRRNAYYNLDRLSVRVILPDEGQCGTVSSPPGCGRTLHACVFTGSVETHVQETAWVSSAWVAVRFSGSAEGAHVVSDSESGRRMPDDAFDGTSENARADLLLSYSPECPDCGDEVSCEVVSADACAGYVGLVCETRVEGKKPKRVVKDVGIAVPN